jgi:hypothetical protein
VRLSELTSAMTLNRVTHSACHDYIAGTAPGQPSAAEADDAMRHRA